MDLKSNSSYAGPYCIFILRNFPTIIALVLLGSVSYYSILHRPYDANHVAEYAFYVLVVAVMYKIAEGMIYDCYLKKEGTSFGS